jgi:hypothetical protein
MSKVCAPEQSLVTGYNRLIEVAGSCPLVAKDRGLSRAAVNKWRKKGIPLEAVPALEERYSIPRWELRPDHYRNPFDEIERWRGWFKDHLETVA